MSKQPLCPQCSKKTLANRNFCPNCGYMIRKPQIIFSPGIGTKKSRPSAGRVDEAFKNLGLDDKMMKEQGLSRERILSELAGGVKPKEEVTIGGVKQIGL